MLIAAKIILSKSRPALLNGFVALKSFIILSSVVMLMSAALLASSPCAYADYSTEGGASLPIDEVNPDEIDSEDLVFVLNLSSPQSSQSANL